MPDLPADSPPREGRRLHSLDGLRGLAAAVVLLHHTLLTVPSLAAAYYGDHDSGSLLARVLTDSPLHLAWAGTEAVFVFFVLSGLVLALPWTAGRGRSWPAYYAQRAVRLYLPVAVAVVWAYALIAAVPRDDRSDMGPWLGVRSDALAPFRAVKDLVLVDGPSGLITPFWSLQWEVWFSVLLPVYLWAVLRWRVPAPLVATALVAASTLGAGSDNRALWFLPMFGMGVLLARELDQVRRWGARLGRGAGTALLGVALLLTVNGWLVGADNRDRTWVAAAAVGVALVGASTLVVLAASWPPLQRLLERRPVQFLGTISFSLYLIHEPVIIAAAYLLGPHSWPIAGPLSLILSLGVATVFHRLVEAPSITLSRRAGAALGRRSPVSRRP